MRNNQLIFHGSIVGRDRLTNLTFNPEYYFSGCLLCGEVYQAEADRNPPSSNDLQRYEWLYDQKQRHLQWRDTHNGTHTEREHRRHAISGAFATPEAALKLAPLGIFSLTDLVSLPEVASALGEAPRAPISDAQVPKGE